MKILKKIVSLMTCVSVLLSMNVYYASADVTYVNESSPVVISLSGPSSAVQVGGDAPIVVNLSNNYSDGFTGASFELVLKDSSKKIEDYFEHISATSDNNYTNWVILSNFLQPNANTVLLNLTLNGNNFIISGAGNTTYNSGVIKGNGNLYTATVKPRAGIPNGDYVLTMRVAQDNGTDAPGNFAYVSGGTTNYLKANFGEVTIKVTGGKDQFTTDNIKVKYNGTEYTSSNISSLSVEKDTDLTNVEVYFNNTRLTKTTDYTITAATNNTTENGTMTINAAGSHYTGNVELKGFKVTDKTQTFTGLQDTYDATYSNGGTIKLYTARTGTGSVTITKKDSSAPDVINTTINDGAVTIGKAGTAVYTLSAAAVSNEWAAFSKDITINVAKANLTASNFTITAPTEQTYNAAAKSVSAPTANGVTGIGTITVKYAGSATVPIDAGTYAVTFDVAEGDNYNAASGLTIGTLKIAPKGVTISGVTAENKTYDGTTTATASGTATINSLESADSSAVSVKAGTAAFADQYVGTNKTVTFSGYSLEGNKAKNYNLTAQPTSATANINAATQTPTFTTPVSLAKDGNTLDLRTLVSGNQGDLHFTIDGTTYATLGSDGYTLTSTATTGEVKVTVTADAKDLGGSTDAEYSAYSGSEQIKVNVVNKLDADVSISEDASLTKVYGDADFTLNATAATPGNEAGTWTWTSSDTSVATVTGDGASASVKIIKNGRANINAKYESATHIDDATVALTVDQREVSIVWDGNAERVYDGNASNVTATISNKVGSDVVSLTVTGGTETNASDTAYTATAALNGTDAGKYKLPTTPTTTYKINKATLVGDPAYESISEADKKLSDAKLAVNPDWKDKTGQIAWKLSNDTVVERGQDYEWTYTPNDTTNYAVATGSIVLWKRPSSNNVAGGTTTSVVNVGDNTAASDTTTSDDGVTTTTKTEADGSKTETAVAADGTEATTKTDPEGNVTEVSVEVSDAAVAEAAESDEPVSLPVEVEAADSTEEAAPVSISVKVSEGSVKVEIPVASVSAGDVVVLVNEDGTEEILPKSMLTEDGIVIEVSGDITIKIIDNSKDFRDVANSYWGHDAIDFVSAREIFNGTGEGQFTPEGTMSRAMLATALYRMERQPEGARSVDFSDVKQDTWYTDAIGWAAEQGIVEGYEDGGFGVNDPITRQQLATMLYRMEGRPAVSPRETGAASWAADAMSWAVETGIIQGDGESYDANGHATRAATATMLMRYINK